MSEREKFPHIASRTDYHRRSRGEGEHENKTIRKKTDHISETEHGKVSRVVHGGEDEFAGQG